MAQKLQNKLRIGRAGHRHIPGQPMPHQPHGHPNEHGRG